MRNLRKIQILSLFRQGAELTARDIAEQLPISRNNSRNLLLHYHRLGLLRRRTLEKRDEKIYSLSERGLQRLEVLSGQRR